LLLAGLTVVILGSCHPKEPGEEPTEEGVYPPMGLIFTLSGGGDSRLLYLDLRNFRIAHETVLQGASVKAVTVNANGDRLVLADGLTMQLSMLRLPGLSEVQVLPLGGNTEDLETDAGGWHIYAVTHNGSFWTDTVATGNLDTMEVALHPRRLTLRPPYRNEAWVVSSDQKKIQMINLVHREMFDSLEFSDTPTDVQFSPDGTKAYVALQGEQAGVAAYAPVSHNVLASYPGGEGPFELAVSDDGRYLAASDSTAGTVLLWDVASGGAWSVDVGAGAGPLSFEYRTHMLYVLATGEGRLTRMLVTENGPQTVDSLRLPYPSRCFTMWEVRR
jgi:DNA-binding beta-propeller fold protein YncE